MASSIVKPDASASLDGSQSLTAIFYSQCPWLSSGEDEKHDESIEVKLVEIEDCLDGNEHVDLWQLREQCLSTGGLLSSQVRRRAWPKLMGAHQHVLVHSIAEHGNSNAPTHHHDIRREVTQHDMKRLQDDLSNCSWDVTEQVWINRERERVRKVRFVPELTVVSPSPSPVLDMPPLSPASTPTSQVALPDSETQEPPSPMTMTPQSQLYLSRRKRASPHEELVLKNTVVSLLRSASQERYHYYHGLHDLTAVFLIVLESPSLTSLVLQQVATYHLRDYLRENNDDLWKHSIQSLFTNLLFKVDPVLQQHLDGNFQVLDWIPSWFTSQVSSIDLASRLVDVFLVSHATMPIYVSVAFLRHYRDHLLDSADVPQESLPSLLLEDERPMDAMEGIISSAVEFIRIYPPQTLCENLPSITLLQDPPEWAMQPHAPSDWTLLQHAKALRKGEASAIVFPTYSSQQDYALATTALGLPAKPKRRRVVWKVLLAVIVVLLGVVAAAGIQATHSSTHAPTTERRVSRKTRTLRTSSKVRKKMRMKHNAVHNAANAFKTAVRAQVRELKQDEAEAHTHHRRVEVRAAPATSTSTAPRTLPKLWKGAHNDTTRDERTRVAVPDWFQVSIPFVNKLKVPKLHMKRPKVQVSIPRPAIKMPELAFKLPKLAIKIPDALPQLAERLIVESDRLKWEGQRFLL